MCIHRNACHVTASTIAFDIVIVAIVEYRIVIVAAIAITGP